MITLYGMSSPNVIKVLLMLEELEAEYVFQRCDVFAGDQHDPSFRAVSPNGKVPAIRDDEGPDGPLSVFESGAILIYLAEKSGRFLPQKGAARAEVLQWLMFQMAGVGPMFGQALHFQDPARGQYAHDRYQREMLRICGVIETRLSDRAYIAGPDYTIADMAIFPWSRTLERFFPGFEFAPETSRWRKAIADRPATQRAIQRAEALSLLDRKSMKAATPEQLDKYYGRSD